MFFPWEQTARSPHSTLYPILFYYGGRGYVGVCCWGLCYLCVCVSHFAGESWGRPHVGLMIYGGLVWTPRSHALKRLCTCDVGGSETEITHVDWLSSTFGPQHLNGIAQPRLGEGTWDSRCDGCVSCLVNERLWKCHCKCRFVRSVMNDCFPIEGIQCWTAHMFAILQLILPSNILFMEKKIPFSCHMNTLKKWFLLCRSLFAAVVCRRYTDTDGNRDVSKWKLILG